MQGAASNFPFRPRHPPLSLLFSAALSARPPLPARFLLSLMNWKILAVGKPALPWARDGIEDYFARFTRYARVEVEYFKDAPRPVLEERFLKASEGSRRIVLDERGQRLSTTGWRFAIDQWELAGTKRISILIGGADGHSPELRAQADDVWSLSALTFQHELALVVLLEQLYRVYTIKRGEPYHR